MSCWTVVDNRGSGETGDLCTTMHTNRRQWRGKFIRVIGSY
jgi:hypothetical protein